MGSPEKGSSGKGDLLDHSHRGGSENKDESIRITIGNEHFDREDRHRGQDREERRYSRSDYEERRSRDYDRRDRYDDRGRDFDRERYERERYERERERERYEREREERYRHDERYDSRDRYDRYRERERDDYRYREREREDDRYERDRHGRFEERPLPKKTTSSLSLEDDYRSSLRAKTSMGPRSTLSLEEDKKLQEKEMRERNEYERRERERVRLRERERMKANEANLEKTKEADQGDKIAEKPADKDDPKNMPLYPEEELLTQQQFGKWGSGEESPGKPKPQPESMFKTGNWKPITNQYQTTFPIMPSDESNKKSPATTPTSVTSDSSRPLRSILKNKPADSQPGEELPKNEPEMMLYREKLQESASLFPIKEPESVLKPSIEKKAIPDIPRMDITAIVTPKLDAIPSTINSMDIDDEDKFLYGDGDDGLDIPKAPEKLTAPSPGSSASGSLVSGRQQISPRRERYRSPSPDHKRRRKASPDGYFRNKSPEPSGYNRERPSRPSLSPTRMSRSPHMMSRSPPMPGRSSHHIRSHSPPMRSHSPTRPSHSPHMKSQSPQMRSRSPQMRSRSSPQMRSLSPHMRSRSPQMRPHSPHMRSRSPPMRSRSPHLRSRSPQMRSHSPHLLSRSPQLRSRSPIINSPFGSSRSPPRHVISPAIPPKAPSVTSDHGSLRNRSQSPPSKSRRDDMFYRERQDGYNRDELPPPERIEHPDRRELVDRREVLDQRESSRKGDIDLRKREVPHDGDLRQKGDVDLRKLAADLDKDLRRNPVDLDKDARRNPVIAQENKFGDRDLRQRVIKVEPFPAAISPKDAEPPPVKKPPAGIPPWEKAKKTERELPPWEKKRLEREAESHQSPPPRDSPPEPTPEPPPPKEEKKEAHDPTIENILKSIGFNFELSKMMQEKANKERAQKKDTEEFGIKESASFMATGIVSGEDKKKSMPDKESYVERAKRYLEEHARAKALGRESPLPFDKQIDEERASKKLRSASREHSFERPDIRLSRERRSRSGERYKRSQSRSPSHSSKKYRRSRSRDRYPHSHSRSYSRSRSRSRSRERRHSRSRSDSSSSSSSDSRSRSKSPVTSSTAKETTAYFGANGQPTNQYPGYVLPYPGAPGQGYPPQPLPDAYGQFPPYGTFVPAYGMPPVGIPGVPLPAGMPPGQIDYEKDPGEQAQVRTSNLRVLTSGDADSKSSSSNRTVIPPRSDLKMVRDKLSRAASKDEGEDKRKVMMKSKEEKEKAKAVPRMLTASERATLMAQSAERKRRLAALEKELDRLRRQQNELMRKRQRQKDGHKDPLLAENSKLQEEIAKQISALRKSVEENASALVESGQKSAEKERSGDKAKETEKRGSSGLSKEKEEKKKVPEKEKVKDVKKEEPAEPEIEYSYFDPGNHWCRPCNFLSTTLYKHFEHLGSKRHLLKMDPYERPWMTDKDKKKDPIKRGTQVHAAPLQGVEFMSATQAFFCKMCLEFSGDVMCAEQHLKSKEHNKKYKEYCEENQFYERRFALDKAAGISMLSGQWHDNDKSDSPTTESSKDQKPVKKERHSSSSIPMPPKEPPRQSLAEVERQRNEKNKEALKKQKELNKKEQEANKNVIELESDTSKPALVIPIVGKRIGVAARNRQQQKETPTSTTATAAAAADNDQSRKGISIKLTGKTQLSTKPASNPLQTLTKTASKPVVVPQRLPTFLPTQLRKQKLQVERSPPPSLDSFLSISKGTDSRSVPVYATVPDMTDPKVLAKVRPEVREKIEEMRMLGILPEKAEEKAIPRPPPQMPSAGIKPSSNMAAADASKIHGVFFGSKDKEEQVKEDKKGEDDAGSNSSEVEMDMGDFDILDECGDA